SIVKPPVSVGGVKETLAWPSPAAAVTLVGAAGTVDVGVTEFDAAESAPLPFAFTAATVKVYETWSLVRPVTVIGDWLPAALTVPPMFALAVTMYDVMARPEGSAAGGSNVTVACPCPAAATAWAGAFGVYAMFAGPTNTPFANGKATVPSRVVSVPNGSV